MSNATAKFRMQDLLNLAARHKLKVVLWPLICLFVGGLFFVFCPRTYRSEARLFLRVGRESVGVDPAATTGHTIPLHSVNRKEEVKSAEEVFKSRSVAAQVVDQLGPDVVLGRGEGGSKDSNFLATILATPLRMASWVANGLDPISDREKAIIRVERSLNVEAEPQATVLVVQYDADSPQLAQTLCDAIVEIGVQEHMRVHRNEKSRLFFSEQQDQLREQLDTSLEALRDAKNEMGLASIDSRRTMFEGQFSAIALDRLQSNQQLATSQARIEDLQRQLAEIPEWVSSSKTSVPNQGADLMRDRLFELQVKSMDLEARYNDTHPLVKAVNDQLKEAKKVLAEQSPQRMESTDGINRIHRDLTLALKQELSTVAGLMARLEALDRQESTVLADLRAVNQHEVQIDQLARDVDLARSKYQQYARNLEEARIDKELEIEMLSNIGVVQAATMAEKPVVPSRSLTAAGTFLLAIAGGLALVLLGVPQHQPSPPVSAQRMVRRIPRRRASGQLAPKANGHSEVKETQTVPE